MTITEFQGLGIGDKFTFGQYEWAVIGDVGGATIALCKEGEQAFTFHDAPEMTILEKVEREDDEWVNPFKSLTELESEIERLRKVEATASKIVDLVFSATDTEATEFPFWYVAVKGSFGKVTMVSDGVWFNRETAEEHLRKKAHRYSKNAFVYCDSAHASYGGLRELYGLADELRKALAPYAMLPSRKTVAEEVAETMQSLPGGLAALPWGTA